MRTLLAFAVVVLSGCSTVASWIPSFSDPNQSARIIDVRQSVERIDCGQPQLSQVEQVQKNLQWFHLYSESAGFRHADVLRVIEPLETVTNEWAERASKGEPSAVYCKLKKDILAQGSAKAAKVILGRF